MGTKNNMPLLLKTILHASYCSFDKSIHFVPNKINVNQIKDVLELTELAGEISFLFQIFSSFILVPMFLQ